jgi:diazepam-binding inhibitor (GABA receptor modulating acyl-CoA-binding protein)
MNKYKYILSCRNIKTTNKQQTNMNDEHMMKKLEEHAQMKSQAQEMRSNLEQSFLDAAARIKTRASTPSNGDLLILYGLYKQATAGDCDIAQPWAIQVEARAKWEAWNRNKKMERINAMRNYIDKVEELMSR